MSFVRFPVLLLMLAAIPNLAGQAPVIRYGGLTWVLKRSLAPTAPGPNLFSSDPRQAFVDEEGRLRLSLREEKGLWHSVELSAREKTGYGRYRVELEGDARDLDPSVVFGFFTWDRGASPLHREIDIELSRWADPAGPELWLSVQPYEQAGNQASFRLPKAERFSFELLWKPGVAEFSGYADGKPFAAFTRDKGVPDPGNVRLHINLWLFRGAAPQGTGSTGLTIRSLSYEALEALPSR